MTDKTRQDSGSTHIIRYALELGLLWIDGDGRDKVREALDALDALEAQLEAIGAGGVSGPLMGGASLSANAGAQRKVFLVATGEEHEGEATYTRYDDKPPPLCDSECLFAAPPTAQAEGWQSIETAPKEGVFLVFMQDEVRPARRMQVANWHPNVKIVGGLFAFDCAKVTRWMPLPRPPTSAEGVEHG